MRFELVKLRKSLEPTPEEIQARKESVKNKKGLSQKEMANRLEVTRQHYANLEHGLSEPSYGLMLKFEKVFEGQYQDIWELFKKSE